MDAIVWVSGCACLMGAVPFVVYLSVRLGVFAAIVGRYRADRYLEKRKEEDEKDEG